MIGCHPCGLQLPHLDTVRVLVEAGANRNQATKTSVTPLHIAAAGGHLEVVRVLVESGADINLTTKDGQTAWDLASMNGHQEVVHELGRNLDRALC